MKTIKTNSEIDLSNIIKNIVKNRVKLFIIVIITISITIAYEKNKKPFVPLYEVSLEVREISLIEEQQYYDLNNNFKLMTSYLNNKNIEFNYENDVLVNAKILLEMFVSLFEDHALEYFYNKKIGISNFEVTIKDNESDYNQKTIILKFNTDEGNLEIWNESFQNIYDAVNDQTRSILIVKIRSFINSLNTFALNINFYPEGEIMALDNMKDYINRHDSIIKKSPINNLEQFKSAKMKLPTVKIINKNEKGRNLKEKILISIIISLILFIIYVYIEDIIRNEKKKN